MPQITDANRRWWVLIGTSAGLFLLMLDSTVVALALPAIQADLRASDEQLQWVLNAYLLVIAALVVTAGRFGDIFGRRRVFLLGIAVFGFGSFLCAAAWNADALIVGRIVMAAGAASVLPLSLALVTYVFPKEEQQRAIGIWTAVSAIALGVGPLVGGLLTDVNWRLIFVINIPFVLLALVVVRSAAVEIRDETTQTRIDWPGFALLTAGLTATVGALVESDNWGWTSAATLGLLVGGTLALVAFWFVEHRVRNPIVEFPLFRNRPYLGATVAAFGVVATYWTLMFFEPQYLQNILGYSATGAGLLILPLTVPMIVVSPWSNRLVARFGARVTMTFGVALGVVGLVILTQISASSGYDLLFPGLLVMGISIALVYAPMSAAAMAAMPKAKAGIASAVLAMNRVLAGAVGLAVVTAVFRSLEHDELHRQLASQNVKLRSQQIDDLDGLLAGSETARNAIAHAPASAAEQIKAIAAGAFTFALGHALWVLVGMLGVCAVLTGLLLTSKPRQTEPAAGDHLHHRSIGLHI